MKAIVARTKSSGGSGSLPEKEKEKERKKKRECLYSENNSDLMGNGPFWSHALISLTEIQH